MAELAWIVPILPLASFLIISFVGQKVKGDGDKVGIAALLGAFILSLMVFSDVMAGARAAGSFVWGFVGDISVRLGYQVDPLSATMLLVVTLVSLLVHIYSQGYMHGDARYKRYYSVLSLFTASMLGLVLSDNLLGLFIFWELIGLCSYLLIGHWYDQDGVPQAAMKAFMTTRVGDIAMLIGIMVIFFETRSFQFGEIADAVHTGALSGTTLAVAALLIFGGAVGKSAQFPLHTWLPDAMAGPTPVSALIHAATLVAAGVYLVARSFDLFAAAESAMQVVAWVGAFTAIFAASIALVVIDIKRVLAYSTLSQLGFMVAALGAGAYTAGFFHLVTHAVFKALLFLAAGSVMHGVHTQDMREMGGLRKKMPTTFWTWMIGSAALAGIYPLAGFWSKDEILLSLHETSASGIFWILVIASVMTAFYIARATILTFFGAPRNKKLFDHAHESPTVMTLPMIVLATLAVVVGFVNSPHMGYWFSEFVFFEHAHVPPSSSFVVTLATLSWIVGIAIAFAMYRRGLPDEALLRRSGMSGIWTVLHNKYYVDEVYNGVFVGGTVATSRATGEFDTEVIDGAVNGVGALFKSGSSVLRRIQTGLVQSYALTLFLAVVLGLVIFAIGG